MVRNAADHGIELPSERTKKGKPAAGTITLKAFHEAGHVNIELCDDGKGIDSGKIAEKALSMGLITEEKLRGMTDYDKTSLIFLQVCQLPKKLPKPQDGESGWMLLKIILIALAAKYRSSR
jgi:chemotaxis protein histidine kinase CheA